MNATILRRVPDGETMYPAKRQAIMQWLAALWRSLVRIHHGIAGNAYRSARLVTRCIARTTLRADASSL